jgi:siroheme synthase (precorrin-2 oxidase/ferrochelatase)
VVTVGTGGRSPALAAWMKERFTAELGPEYETLLELLSEAREAMRADGRSTEDADWKRALDSGMLELVRAGRVTEAKELLRSCLSSSLA